MCRLRVVTCVSLDGIMQVTGQRHRARNASPLGRST